MFRNYLQVAFRNLIKNPLYSLINISGLAVGLAACILISLFVRDELSYDTFWTNADSLYRLNTTFEIPGREPFVTVVAQGPVKDQLEIYFDEDVVASTRFQALSPVIKLGEKSFTEEVHWTDPETASMFDFDVLAGSVEQALNDNSSLVINESFAIKYFARTDVVGEVVNLRVEDMNRDFRIGAVIRDLPHNTVLDFQALAMIDEGDWTEQPYLFEHWFSVNNHVFFQLREGLSVDSFNSRLADFTNNSIEIPQGALAQEDVQASDFIKYSTQAIGDIQLNPAGGPEMKPTGNGMTVAIFAVIAGLTLLIACINFMNLATARSTQRAREVSLRKVLGARRSQLIYQFLGESVLLALIGMLFGMVIVELVLPAYSNFLGKDLVFSYLDGFTLFILLGLVVVVGLVGGVYPALVLSSFRPARVLKANKSAESSGSTALRNALVVFQFTISIALIVATVTVYGQMVYATSMDPGFNKDQLIAIAGASRQGVAEKQESLKQELLKLPNIVDVALASEAPFESNENNTSVTIPGNPEAGSILMGNLRVDYDFLTTLKIPLIAGRDYSREFALDAVPEFVEGEEARGNLLVNEAAVRRLGFGTAQEALGRQILMELGGSHDGAEGRFTVVGIVADMNFQSLKTVIRPEMYLLTSRPVRNVLVRFSGDPKAAGAAVESVWNSMIPDVPLSYTYVDQVAAEEFTQELNMATMLGLFSALAVVIACLGLYGLASFTAERRTKEIGIRRVLGASVSNIVGLLLWQFSKPVLLANLLAWPIAVWSMIAWLENFPYRLDSWLLAPLCVFAGLLALVISWLTVGGNAARVARRNPIQALRYE